MHRRQALLELGAALDAAGDDWRALAHAEAALAQQLPALAAGGQWNAAERGAAQQLRAAHARACQLCAGEQARLAGQLRGIQTNKEGWMAYALISETDQDGNQG